jgi:Ca-activated chloride channel family protein
MIAAKTGGTYQLFSTADEVTKNLVAELSQMDKKLVGGGEPRAYNSYFQWFLLAALVLLLVEVIVPERKMKWFASK